MHVRRVATRRGWRCLLALGKLLLLLLLGGWQAGREFEPLALLLDEIPAALADAFGAGPGGDDARPSAASSPQDLQ